MLYDNVGRFPVRLNRAEKALERFEATGRSPDTDDVFRFLFVVFSQKYAFPQALRAED